MKLQSLACFAAALVWLDTVHGEDSQPPVPDGPTTGGEPDTDTAPEVAAANGTDAESAWPKLKALRGGHPGGHGAPFHGGPHGPGPHGPGPHGPGPHGPGPHGPGPHGPGPHGWTSWWTS